jgi:membrane-bound lytic murein transglycosylase MltF
MIDLDFSGDSEKSSAQILEEMYTPVDDGEYLLIIADAEVAESKKGKKPSLKVTFKLVEDEKKTIWKYFYLDKESELSMAFLREFLEAVYDESLSGHVSLDPKDLFAKKVIGHVTTQPRSDGATNEDGSTKMQNIVNVFEPAP